MHEATDHCPETGGKPTVGFKINNSASGTGLLNGHGAYAHGASAGQNDAKPLMCHHGLAVGTEMESMGCGKVVEHSKLWSMARRNSVSIGRQTCSSETDQPSSTNSP